MSYLIEFCVWSGCLVFMAGCVHLLEASLRREDRPNG